MGISVGEAIGATGFDRHLTRLPAKYRGAVQDYLEMHSQPVIRQHVTADPWFLGLHEVLPFDVLDPWAVSTGCDPLRSRARLPAAIKDALRAALSRDGHLALHRSALADMVSRMLGAPRIARQSIDSAVSALAAYDVLVDLRGWIQLRHAAILEARLASRVATLCRMTPHDRVAIEAALRQRVVKTTLSAEQREAILATAHTRLLAITGPAGSGKSYVIATLVRIYEELGRRVLVATPTGKAVDVLHARGVTQAVTCHRLLGLTPEDTSPFVSPPSEARKLAGDLLVVDEFTMVDAVLCDRLLQAIPKDMTVVVVGDVDQLRPVGPGAIFEWLLADEQVSNHRLETIARTTGRLTLNGLDIRAGRLPQLGDPTGRSPRLDDAWYDTALLPTPMLDQARKALPRGTAEEVIRLHAIALWITEIAVSVLPRAFEVEAGADVQIITPQAPGPLGTIHLSALVRNRVNPLAAGERDGRVMYADGNRVRPGDQIVAIDTVCDSVRNGTHGTVRRVDHATKSVFVHIVGQRVPLQLPTAQLRRFILRYALTVDWTQGSEYPVVVQVCHEGTTEALATRRRLYTGYTRGRRASVLVGSDARIRYSLGNTMTDHRDGTFPDRLRQALGGTG